MSPDLKIAKIYVSVMGAPEIKERAMERLEEITQRLLEHGAATSTPAAFANAIELIGKTALLGMESLDKLKEAGAAVIAFDVVFAEPSDPAQDAAFAAAPALDLALMRFQGVKAVRFEAAVADGGR